ncbi:MAG: sulfotransferase [Maricaulis sp.]|uniref:sulfotransferase n=1 Tax=Maricaulis sp. TaxID=1486257 RepID=UPI001B1176E1|nr:sulfotransferase [Maricaulis sp.]MBO6728438.1 sulfotransferase [Maricaulis sp.]MBO6878199.1 sulfotransferase [Maricaulis sp.]
MTDKVPDFKKTNALIESVLERMSGVTGRNSNGQTGKSIQADGLDLSDDLDALQATVTRSTKPLLRTVHHFACTGGTLLSRSIAAQPNTVLLSEVDPFSPHLETKTKFAPADLIRQTQSSIRPLSEAGLERTFMASLQGMYEATIKSGRHIVLRDHTHSHFCRGTAPAERTMLIELVSDYFEPRPLVTVRHPLDSFISLSANSWITFAPGTLNEYARRYSAFLDAYEGILIVRYEDFVLDPELIIQRICAHFELSVSRSWREHLRIIELSGDSGRTSDSIEPRPRRPLPPEIAEQVPESAEYEALCDRLSYSPDPADDPFKV